MSDMDNAIYVEPLNNQHRQDIGIALGLSVAINTIIAGNDKFGKLPGFNTALALVEAIEAQHRAHIAGLNFRAVTAAGHDISTNMVGLVGRGQIYVKPMDLEQLADFGREAK